MYIQCLEQDECGFFTYASESIEQNADELIICPECSSPCVTFSDEFWQTKRALTALNVARGLSDDAQEFITL